MSCNVLLVGNTGVGKSFLLNSLGASFVSGFSVVNGLTMVNSYCNVTVGGSAVRLIDAPGLLEASDENTARNGRVISEALRSTGEFKLIFVLSECAGRVTPLDLYTIGKVLSAIGFSIDVGVVINKVPKDDLKLYRQGPTLDEIFLRLNSLANGRIKPTWFAVIPQFGRGDTTGPRPYMTELLTKMTSQDIQSVEEIRASGQEHSSFLGFLGSVTRWVFGLWFVFEQYLAPLVFI